MLDSADVISTYSRADAIYDGVLVDLNAVHGDLMKEAGIVFPAAMTATCYAQWVEPTLAEKQYGQSADGRMWDVCTMFKHAVRQQREKHTILMVELRVQKVKKTCPQMRIARIKTICGPGDNFEPVLTFMLPEED